MFSSPLLLGRGKIFQATTPCRVEAIAGALASARRGDDEVAQRGIMLGLGAADAEAVAERPLRVAHLHPDARTKLILPDQRAVVAEIDDRSPGLRAKEIITPARSRPAPRRADMQTQGAGADLRPGDAAEGAGTLAGNRLAFSSRTAVAHACFLSKVGAGGAAWAAVAFNAPAASAAALAAACQY